MSNEVFSVMDNIGYSPGMIEERRKVFRDKDAIMNSRSCDMMYITAGSKAEGFSSCFERDYDRLNVYLDIVCVFPTDDNTVPDQATVLYMIDKGCSPGHFMLQISRKGPVRFKTIEAALQSNENGEIYISSDLFTQELERTVAMDTIGGWNKGKRRGPAVPSARGIYCRDDVYAFRCLCQKSILSKWAVRERAYNWPSSELIEEILRLEAHLVPVGCKGSENQKMEWRVCFVPGEMKLIDSLNETQCILYILLKMINRLVLKPVCAEISSYIMKNITFWIAEKYPSEMFVPKNIFLLLKIGLEILRTALLEQNLSFYMIPEINLLSGVVDKNGRFLLVNKLYELTSEGTLLIERLPKIYESLRNFTPEQLKLKGQERDTLEHLELTRQHIVTCYSLPGLKREETDTLCWKDNRYREARFRMYDMVWPEWRQSLRSCKETNLLEDTIQSMNGLNKFPDQYRRFAKSYLDIIWPHMKEEVDDTSDISDEDIVEGLAILRAKIEKALS